MALDINGYNSAFKSFVDFAQGGKQPPIPRYVATATLTQSITADLSGPGSDMNDPKSFGQVTFSQRLVIDLEPDIPVVTDYKLLQTIE